METTIGGDRLGSGNKQQVAKRNFERSTHDLTQKFRSSMSAGTLVPFLCEIALPGDNFEIELDCIVMTLPTIGPLFGSFKIQADVFQVPMRLYNSALYTDRVEIGMNMSNVFFPKIQLRTNNHEDYVQTFDDNEHINASCIFKYLGISGLGRITGTTNPATRNFNVTSFLSYWDIVKQYYTNKQEERGFVIHTGSANTQAVTAAILIQEATELGNIFNNLLVQSTAIDIGCIITFGTNTLEPNPELCNIVIEAVQYPITDIWENITWDDTTKQLICLSYIGDSIIDAGWRLNSQNVPALGGFGSQIGISEFPLSNIDEMRDTILQHPLSAGELVLDETAAAPYGLPMEEIGTGANATYSMQYTQEGLALKTYQSDLFNNWIDTEWIDGTGGINEITSVSTAGDSFTIDAINIASKLYKMLNHIAISGGTYDDWLEAVYTHERTRNVNTPIYHGSLIKELAFEEVISQSETDLTDGKKPLGTLAGRGRMTDKHKGGYITMRIDEPSYIIGIISLTPRIEYSQGNKWDVNLQTFNDLHKPDLDAIGYQDLITEQMCWTDTELNSDTGEITQQSAGKQPAWINYMTAVDKVFGNFAEEQKEMFMVLNRRYEKNASTGRITDLTTYIDPTKFNHIFAETALDAQNFWVQVNSQITARRKMSAKVIPNL